MPICPCVWDLRKPGRDVEHSDFEMKADSENWRPRFSQESCPTASLFRISHSSCVRLPAYHQHIPFSIQTLGTSFFFLEGKDGSGYWNKSWEILGETGECDPDFWSLSSLSWFKWIGQTPSQPPRLFKPLDATKAQPHLGWLDCRKWGKRSQYLTLQSTVRLRE